VQSLRARRRAKHVRIAYYKCRIFTLVMDGCYETPAGQTTRDELML